MSPTPAEIKAARKAKGLTQTAAGALVHAPLITWAQWERGRSPIHPASWELFLIKTAKLPNKN